MPAEYEVATIPISTSVRQSAPPPVPDSDLLAAFVERKDQAALTAIVERYSTLVYRVALRSLNDRHLADDVFQATFLVLAQSARRIKDGDLLAAWLHGTTRNLARRALTHKQSQRNQLAISTSLTRSQKGGEMSTPAELDPLDQLVRRHEQQLLDEELQNLPESSRAPLVLYYLEEKSQAEIAQLMGLSVDAVEGRLRRAKHDLRLRLIRRGVTLSGVVAAATLLTPSFAAAAPTPALISTTITAALGTAAGTSLAAASTTAATLATKEVAAMSLASKAAAFVFGTAGVLTVSAGLIFGAVVTSMGRYGAERQAAAARVLAERNQESEEISTELPLVDEVPAELAQAASPRGENAPGEAQKSNANQVTESPHDQIQQISEVDAEVLKLKQELSERQSVLAKDHPDVQKLEEKIRQLQLSMEAKDLLREKDNEILKWQKMYREEQIEKEMQRDQVARREKENAELVEKLNAVTSNEALPITMTSARAVAPPVPAAVSKQVQEHSPELEKILAQWKAKSAGVRDFSGSFKRLEFDTIFATETRSQGRLKFERPDSGLIDFDPANAGWLQKPGRVTKDGKPYKIVSGEASIWLSTGTSAYALHMKDKTYDLFDIPPAFRGRYLETLPPHSQFGMQPPPMDGSYRFELGQLHNPDGSKRDADGQAMPKAIHIVAICQAPQSDRGLKAVKFLGLEWPVFRDAPDTLEYLLDTDTYLPLNVRTLDTSGNKETVYSFDHSSMKVNEGFGTLTANPFKQPDLTGWKLIHDIKGESAPAQEQPVSAKPQNETIVLSICMFETTTATVEGLTVESSGKRVPKEGFRKLLDEAVKSKQARIISEPSIVLPLGKSCEFLSGGEIPVPVDGDQTKTSNSLQFGTKFTLNPYRRSAEGLFVAISGELSTPYHGENDDNKGADLPTVEGRIIRAFVMIPAPTHQAIVGPIWKSERMNSSGETEKVGIYLRIREDAFRDLPAAAPAAPTLTPPEPKTIEDAQPETIARVIDLAELPQTTPSEVAEALKLLVEPESWNGASDIKPLGKSIVVRNRSEVVEQCVKTIHEMIESEKKRAAEEREKAAQSSPEL